jgi:hypothetical protein
MEFFDVKRIEATFLLITLLFFAGCEENKRAHYATAADAVKDGAFERGWLPEVLRSDAADIQEFHDLDSNHGGATFRYTGEFVQRLEHLCTQVPPNESVRSPLASWPRFLYEGETAAKLKSQNIDVYKCDAFNTAVDLGNHLGYVWH